LGERDRRHLPTIPLFSALLYPLPPPPPSSTANAADDEGKDGRVGPKRAAADSFSHSNQRITWLPLPAAPTWQIPSLQPGGARAAPDIGCWSHRPAAWVRLSSSLPYRYSSTYRLPPLPYLSEDTYVRAFTIACVYVCTSLWQTLPDLCYLPHLPFRPFLFLQLVRVCFLFGCMNAAPMQLVRLECMLGGRGSLLLCTVPTYVCMYVMYVDYLQLSGRSVSSVWRECNRKRAILL
jgi:hypothetical protein